MAAANDSKIVEEQVQTQNAPASELKIKAEDGSKDLGLAKRILGDIPGVMDYFSEEAEVDQNTSINEALFLACCNNLLVSQEVFAILLNAGADPNFTFSLLDCAKDPAARSRTFSALLGLPAFDTMGFPAEPTFPATITPLMFALRNWGPQVIELLLEFGADYSVRDDRDYTALDWACFTWKPGRGSHFAGMRDRFCLKFIDPDMNVSHRPWESDDYTRNMQADVHVLRNQNGLPFLAHIYRDQIFRKAKCIEEGAGCLPLPICELVSHYAFNFEKISKLLNTPFLQKQFLMMAERAFKKYILQKKLERLGLLSEKQLDAVLRLKCPGTALPAITFQMDALSTKTTAVPGKENGAQANEADPKDAVETESPSHQSKRQGLRFTSI